MIIDAKSLLMLFNCIGVAVLVTDSQGSITAVNDLFIEMSGYSIDELRGKSPVTLKAGSESSLYYWKMWDSIRSNGYWIGNIEGIRKDRSLFKRQLSIMIIKNDLGDVTHYVGCIADPLGKKESGKPVDPIAYMDPLTGLLSRGSFTAFLENQLEVAGENNEKIALIHLNMDRFRLVNDAYGFSTGDSLLMEIARRLHRVVRYVDILTRLGGDEFAIAMLRVHERSDISAMVQHILDEIAKSLDANGHELLCTCSAGISVFPDDAGSVEEMLNHSSIALEYAKSEKQNSFRFYSGDMRTSVYGRLEMEKELRKAIANDELVVHYQPQINLKNGRICGVEALVRWQHPVSGLLMPSEFIPLAEETGLITALGEQVLEKACLQIRKWNDMGLPAIVMAVNLSAHQVGLSSIVESITAVVERTGVNPAQLELEVTESLVVSDVGRAVEVINQIKKMGILVVMDDFGTGYSSLSYLSRFSFDKVKIDKSFVSDITVNPDSAAIAKAITALAHSLGMKVLAEGVETEGQLKYLELNGCDEVQGYYFSRPVVAEEFETLMRSRYEMMKVNSEGLVEPRTLLIVDDELNVISALQRMFLMEGYNVVTAQNAEEGFEQLAKYRVSVLISDQKMPVMDGIEFLSRVKRLHPDVVRIMLTGYADMNSALEAINRGAIYKFLLKPWNDREIIDVLNEAVHYGNYLRRHYD